jgi:hypothetical protein
MKVRTSIAAVSAAALLAGTGAIAIPAFASTASTASTARAANSASTSASHTLKFTSVTKKTVDFSKTNVGQQDTDVNAKGKTVGFDQLNISVNPKTGKGSILVTIDAKGGFLIGVLPLTSSKTLKGIITGGVGSYKDAFGSITAKALNKAGTREAVTITYTT